MTDVAKVWGTKLWDVVGHSRNGTAYCPDCADELGFDTEKPDREIPSGGVIFRECEGEMYCGKCHRQIDNKAAPAIA